MPDDQLLPPPPKKKNNPDIGADGLLPPPPKKKAKEPSSKNWWNGGKGGNFAGLLGGGVEKSKVEKSAVPKLPIEDISEYNKRFEDATGHKPLNLGSDLPQIKKAREEKKYLTYRDIEEKEIKPVLDDVSRGVVQPEDLKKLYQQPHGRKIVTEAINQELPEVGTMGLDEEVFGNEKKWEGIAQAIQNKNRQQGVDAQNQSEFELDNELANSLKDYTYGQDHIAVRGGGEAVSERQQKSFGDINTTSPDELSAALRNINNSTKVWDSEGKEVDKKTLAKKIGTRLFQIKAQENIHPEIIQLFDKIKTAVSKVPVEWKKQGLSDDLVNTDAEYVSEGLNYIKDADPGRYAMIMGSIDGLGKIAEMDYQQLVGLGKDINSFRKFKQGEYVKKDNRSFLTTQGKKALLGGWLYEELKRTGKNKQTFRIPQKDILEAYKNVPEELKDDDLVRDIIKDEVGPAFGFLPIARGEGIPKRGLGRQILTNTADPFAGILNTIDYSFDSPFGAYQKSKELDRGDNTVINAKGEFTNRSDDKFFNKAVGGLFAFLTQVGIARGIGAVTAKGTNAMIGRVAPRAATVTTSEAALNVGTPLSIIAQQYGDEYVDFLEKTGSPTKAALGAFVSTATQGAIERFVLPDVKIADQAALLFARKNLAKEIIDVVENGGGKAGVGKLIKDFTANTLSTFGKEAIAEENLQNFANYLTEAVISPKTAQNRDLMQESWDITKAATTQMAIPAIFGGAGETKMKRGLNKVQLNHIGVNADAYQDALDNSLTRGIVTQDEYDLSSKIIQLHRNNILNAPKYDSKGELISAERQLEYAYQSTVQETLQQQADKQKDKVQREPIDKKIEEADKIKRQIFYGEEAEGLPPKEGEPVVIDQDRDLMDESDTDALLDELKSKAGELEQGVDLDYFQTKAAEDPNKYIEKYGDATVKKLIDKVPTETLKGNLDLFLEMNPEHPSVKILDKLIAEREEATPSTTPEKATPTEQVSNTDNVGDVKATANALQEFQKLPIRQDVKGENALTESERAAMNTYYDILKDYKLRNARELSEAYHTDKAAGKETPLTKAVEELIGKPQESTPNPKGNTDNVGGDVGVLKDGNGNVMGKGESKIIEVSPDGKQVKVDNVNGWHPIELFEVDRVKSTSNKLENLSEKDFDKLTPSQKVSLYKEHGITKEDGSPITEKDIENSPLQYSYDFMASSESGKWNSANSELESLVKDHRKAYSLYKMLIGDNFAGDNNTFKDIVDYINNKTDANIEYTDRMRRADETMSAEERQAAVDSYNKSAEGKTEDKVQKEKDILEEHGLADETEYSPHELVEKFPLKGVQKVIWDIIKPIVEKLGIKVKFSSSRITEGFDGSNNPMNGEILLRPSTLKNGRLGEVLVHEVVHSLTTKIISRVNSGVETGLTGKQVAAVKGLNKLYKSIEADNNLQNKYPVKDIFEFIAHLTNDSFVKELESKDRNFIQKVVDYISDILGLSNANELAKKYLKDIIHDGTFLEKEGITVVSSDYAANVKGAEGLTPKQRLLEAIKNNSKTTAEKYHDLKSKGKENDFTKAVEQSLSQPSTPTVQEGSVLSENSKKEIGELFDNKGVKDFRLNIPDYYNELIEKGLATKNGDKSVSITDEGKKVVLESRVSDADKKLSFSEDKPNTLEESYEIARKLFSSSGGGDTKYSRIRLKSGKTVQLRISDHNIHTNPQTTDTYILPITFNTNTFSHGKKGYEKFITEPLSEKEIFDYVKSEIEKFGEIEYFKESQSPNIFNTIRQRENDLKQLGSLKSATGSVQEGKGEAEIQNKPARDFESEKSKLTEQRDEDIRVKGKPELKEMSLSDKEFAKLPAEEQNKYDEWEKKESALRNLIDCLWKPKK